MKKEMEQEWKGLISESNYEKLLSHARSFSLQVDERVQINHYFDTTDLLLRNQRTMLRIREIGDAYECTCKIAPSKDSFGSASQPTITEEYTVEMNRIAAEAYINGTLTIDSSLPLVKLIEDRLGQSGLSLRYLGALKTTRTSVSITDGIEPLLLDKSEYLGITDYEFEWETAQVDAAKQHLDQLIAMLGIDVDWNAQAKSGRFFKALHS